MKNKYFKPLIAVLFIVLCAVMLIACRYVSLSASTFKFTNYYKRTVLTMNINSSYNELKATLRQKYAEMLSNSIEETRVEFNSALKQILGEEYVEKRQKLIKLESNLKAQRNEFLNSEDYLNGKEKLKNLKLKIDKTSNEDEKEELQSEFNACLNELSTLNIKFNNVLKAKREEIDALKGQLKALFKSKKGEIEKERDRLEQKTKQNILNIVNQYNFELKELNDAFSVSSTLREMPFDNDFLNDLSVVSNFENDCLGEAVQAESSVKLELVSTDGLDDVVVLENTSKLKS